MSKKNAPNRLSAETIIPLRIAEKSKGIDEYRRRRRHLFGIIILVGLVFILVAAGAWLLHYLSKNPLQPRQVINKPSAEQPDPAPNPDTQPLKPAPRAVTQPEAPTRGVEAQPELPAPKTVTQPEPPPPPPVDPEKIALDKQAAEQKLAEFLEIKNELDGKGAAQWGENFYSEMIEIGRQADAFLIKKAYNPASAEYARATIIGRQLADRTDAALQRMLAEGRIALAEGKGAVAQSKFQVALMIEPSNPSAQKGLKRAQTIETVLQLIDAGKQHEKDKALHLARTEYQKALQLDPDANQAQQALIRVTQLIKERQFNQLISAGLTAFHNNDYALARTRLLKAKSLKPGSREVSDALLQVDQALRLARLDQLRDAAQKAEQSEDWQAALKSYLAMLDIDQNLQFAARGKERAGQQIRIAKRLDFYLSRPQVLESDKQLKNAVLLLYEAKETLPRGQKLTSRIKELEGLVTIAQTPVIITIESDNLTRIAVYKVGKLGRFARHELTLRPGTYTVVGARDGYQDVRRKIVVKPGQQAFRVTVKCEVKI